MRFETQAEKIVRTDFVATAFNRKLLGDDMLNRFVELACGHRAITRNSKSVKCKRCMEMLRRSIETGDEDYDLFRNHNGIDRMSWPDDPCRYLNEAGTP